MQGERHTDVVGRLLALTPAQIMADLGVAPIPCPTAASQLPSPCGFATLFSKSCCNRGRLLPLLQCLT